MSNYNVKLEKLKNIKDDLYGRGTDRKQKQSNFFVSINTLQVATPDFLDLFEVVLETFFENINKFITTFKGYPVDDEREVIILPVIEVGKKYHRLHCHCTIEMTHYSKIKLNLSKIRKYFKMNLDLNGNINLDVHHYYKSKLTDEEKIKSYITKTYNDDDYNFKVGNIEYEFK